MPGAVMRRTTSHTRSRRGRRVPHQSVDLSPIHAAALRVLCWSPCAPCTWSVAAETATAITAAIISAGASSLSMTKSQIVRTMCRISSSLGASPGMTGSGGNAAPSTMHGRNEQMYAISMGGSEMNVRHPLLSAASGECSATMAQLLLNSVHSVRASRAAHPHSESPPE